MAFREHSFFTVVEFGTSKLTVAHCTAGKDGVPEIVGFSSKDSAGCVVKGEIVDLARAGHILSDALAEVDQSAGCMCDRSTVYYLISGPGISSVKGEGSVVLYDENRTITQAHINDAVQKALNIPIQPGMIDIDSFTSSFVLDMKTRVKDPLNHTADRLDALIHIILADRNRLETVRSLLAEAGFENGATPVFSGVASAYGALTRDEKENGALLLDFGAGTIDCLGVAEDGVVVSEVLPLGTDNLANDLAIGLDLHISQARRILTDGRLEAVRNAGESMLEIASGTDAIRRKLPVASIEKILNLRLQETFSILKNKLEEKGVLTAFQSGLVLTGGGAMIPSVPEFASNAFGMHKRIAVPSDLPGVLANWNNPRYTAVFGSLKYIMEIGEDSGASLGKVADLFENLTGGLMSQFKNVTKVFSKK